jgi:hypothetical protein
MEKLNLNSDPLSKKLEVLEEKNIVISSLEPEEQYRISYAYLLCHTLDNITYPVDEKTLQKNEYMREVVLEAINTLKKPKELKINECINMGTYRPSLKEPLMNLTAMDWFWMGIHKNLSDEQLKEFINSGDPIRQKKAEYLLKEKRKSQKRTSLQS